MDCVEFEVVMGRWLSALAAEWEYRNEEELGRRGRGWSPERVGGRR